MQDIENYEAMAMLELSDDERKNLNNRFKTITESFAALDTIEVDDVEPLVTVLDLSNMLREDISEKTLSRDEILSNAPEQQDGYFQVPGILD